MKAEKAHDFSRGQPNPYAHKLNKQLLISLDPAAVAYFESLAKDTGFTAEQLLQDCLRDCVMKDWRPAGVRSAQRKLKNVGG